MKYLILMLTMYSATVGGSQQSDHQRSVGDVPKRLESLDELWRQSSLVLRGIAGEGRLRSIPASRPGPPIGAVEWPVTISSVYKGTDLLRGSAQIRVGSTAPVVKRPGADWTVEMPRVPLLSSGEDVFLFLRTWSGVEGAFTVTGGAAGLFSVQPNAVDVPLEARHFTVFDGRRTIPVQAFEQMIRQLQSGRLSF